MRVEIFLKLNHTYYDWFSHVLRFSQMFYRRSQMLSDVSSCSQDAFGCSKMFHRRSQDDLKMFLRCSNMSIDVLVGLVYMGKMYFLAPGPRINSLQHEFPKKGVFVNHPISHVEIQT